MAVATQPMVRQPLPRGTTYRAECQVPQVHVFLPSARCARFYHPGHYNTCSYQHVIRDTCFYQPGSYEACS